MSGAVLLRARGLPALRTRFFGVPGIGAILDNVNIVCYVNDRVK